MDKHGDRADDPSYYGGAGASSTDLADDFGAFVSYDLSAYLDTVVPSNLARSHTSHDDSCLDTCLSGGGNNPPGVHRGGLTPFPTHRQRFASTSISYPFQAPESHPYSAQPQQLEHLFPELFTAADLKFSLNNDPKPSRTPPRSVRQTGDVFSPSSLGVFQNCGQVADDCVSVDCSQVSCSSACCSTQVCQDESCAEGTPCNDLSCFDGNVHQPFEAIWDMSDPWSTSMPSGSISSPQQCNHTNTEHDVANTLRSLGGPVPSIDMQQHPDFGNFECPIFSTTHHTKSHNEMISILENQPDLTYESTVQSSPDVVSSSAEELRVANQHRCQWIMGPGDLGEQEHLCGRNFSSSCALNDHLCNDHIPLLSSKTKYVCLWKGCSRRDDQVFASRNKLKRHIATHTSYKPYLCPDCGEGFSAQQALDQHMRTHTGEKPYKCTYPGCDKSFKQKSALTMHIRTHTGEKPLKCEICGKCFCESSNLSKHRKTHNPDYKFKCDEPGCDKRFIRVDQLRRHQAKHIRHKKKTQLRSQSSGNVEDLLDTQAYPLTLDGDQYGEV
jgi:hypothetical protein